MSFLTVPQARDKLACSAQSPFDLPVLGNLCIMIGSGASFNDQ